MHTSKARINSSRHSVHLEAARHKGHNTTSIFHMLRIAKKEKKKFNFRLKHLQQEESAAKQVSSGCNSVRVGAYTKYCTTWRLQAALVQDR